MSTEEILMQLHALALKYDVMEGPLAAEIVADLTTIIEKANSGG
jgi:hypothetical protein